MVKLRKTTKNLSRVGNNTATSGKQVKKESNRYMKSRDSSVGIAPGYGLDDRGSRVRFQGRGWEFFSSPPRPERLWGPPSLLYNGYKGFFPWG
jgi:hypothetical protein